MAGPPFFSLKSESVGEEANPVPKGSILFVTYNLLILYVFFNSIGERDQAGLTPFALTFFQTL
jgi:hypothetical protein